MRLGRFHGSIYQDTRVKTPEDYDVDGMDDYGPEERTFVFLWVPPKCLTRARPRRYDIEAWSLHEARTLAQFELHEDGLSNGDLFLCSGHDEIGELDPGDWTVC